MSVKTVNKPDWYGEPEYAWFPTVYACHTFNLPVEEGYISLYHVREVYPETLEDEQTCWMLVNVHDVENPTVIFPPFKRV